MLGLFFELSDFVRDFVRKAFKIRGRRAYRMGAWIRGADGVYRCGGDYPRIERVGHSWARTNGDGCLVLYPNLRSAIAERVECIDNNVAPLFDNGDPPKGL